MRRRRHRARRATTSTPTARTAAARSTRSPPRPRAPGCSSSSSPTTATARARPIRPRIDQACSASTPSRSAPPAATTSRSTCRPRRIRSAGEAARRRRGRPPARRIRHRRASGFAEAELRWRDWAAPIDGIEMHQPGHELARARARSRGGSRKLPAARRARSAYPFRPAETIASLLTDSAEALAQWDALAAPAPVVGACRRRRARQARAARRRPGRQRFSLPLPGYESSFRTLSVHVKPDAPLTGDAAADARALSDGHPRAAHLYTARRRPRVAAIVRVHRDESSTARPSAGDRAARPADPVTLRVRSNAPAGFTTRRLARTPRS